MQMESWKISINLERLGGFSEYTEFFRVHSLEYTALLRPLKLVQV